MNLTGLHFLLSYQCNFECDHCFVWGSPRQVGTLTLRQIRESYRQAKEVGTVEWIYFEGGEPFLYYAVLLKAVRSAREAGFRVGLVSNGYWATEVEDAVEWLRPLAGLLDDLSISTDLYHSDELISQHARNAQAAARELDLPHDVLSIAQPDVACAVGAAGHLPAGQSGVMYRGRAAERLASRAARTPWQSFAECTHEDLCEPGRLHLDYLGNLHICQGIAIGNLFRTPLKEICATYDPHTYPVVSELLAGGPAELVRKYSLPHQDNYADECHLCYSARVTLRERFPDVLTPDQMYGIEVP